VTRTALVTGAGGFAGKHLVEHLLAEGWRVAAAGHNCEWSVDFRMADQVEQAFREVHPDVVFHLAGTSSVAEMERDPVGGAENITVPVAHVLANLGSARLLLVSTCHVYGAGATEEGAPLRPQDRYGAARASAEFLATRSGRDVVIARAFHHTGPGQDRRFALADWAARWRAGEARIPVGNLDVSRDYSDVRDVVAGYRLLAERSRAGEIYNLCSGVTVTMRELFSRLCPGSRPVEDATRVRGREVPVIQGSARKAAALGWTRKWTLDETLADVREDRR
jgi:GDP-4-dehydro-6-deoxy-D-mannose reductase